MPNSDTALIVIDVQESFRHESCWSHSPSFCQSLQQLIDGAKKRGIHIVQIFHA